MTCLASFLYFYCTVNSLLTILVFQNNSSCVCRRQYIEIYFCKLFLVAHFSWKSEKPSDKVPTVHFLLCSDIVLFCNLRYFSQPISLKNLRNLLIRFRQFIFYSATLPSKIVLYSIYIIMYVHGNQLLQTTDLKGVWLPMLLIWDWSVWHVEGDPSDVSPFI